MLIRLDSCVPPMHMLTEDDAFALLQAHCAPLWRYFHLDDYDRLRPAWADITRTDVDLVVAPELATTPRDRDREAQRRHVDGVEIGARLRVALGVVHAVSCCRGFAPTTHPRFWRHVATTLWHTPSLPTAFAVVGIVWAARAVADEAFWIGFCHGTHAYDGAFASVVERLRPHFVSGSSVAQPPPLRVSLSQCLTRRTPNAWHDGVLDAFAIKNVETAVTPDALKTILGGAFDTLTGTWTTPSAALRLGLVVEYRIDDNAYATREMLDLVARARTLPPSHRVQCTIDRLVLQLAPPVPPRSTAQSQVDLRSRRAFATRRHALGALLRELLRTDARVDTVTLFGCSQSDVRLVGAALSAVAWATPPIASLRCKDLCDATQPQDQLLRLAWLAYALHRRTGHRSMPLALALQTTGVGGYEYATRVQELTAQGTPLRDVVDAALRLRVGDTTHGRRVTYLRLGSTVRVARGTRLWYEPFGATNGSALECAVARGARDGADNGTELDAVACVDSDDGEDDKTSGYVGVVYPGYGLVWTSTASVTAWRLIDSDVNDHCVALSSLALSFRVREDPSPPSTVAKSLMYHMNATLPLLKLERLETLALNRAVVTRSCLSSLLTGCSRLHTLELTRCVVESFEPLAQAYSATTHGARVAVLSLFGVRSLRMLDAVARSFETGLGRLCLVEARRDEHAWSAQLLDAVASGVSVGALRKLYIDLAGLWHTDALAFVLQLAPRVAASRSLTRLHVCNASGNDAAKLAFAAACVAHLAPLQDAVLPAAPRVEAAVLSVLHVVGCDDEAVARHVLMLARGDRVRTVTWCCL